MQQAERFDTVVIGGGQAGLAVGYYLAKHGHNFVILDAHARVGDAWRTRWDGLRLFTSGRLNSLPRDAVPRRQARVPHQGRGRRLSRGLRRAHGAPGAHRRPGRRRVARGGRRRVPSRLRRAGVPDRPGRGRHRRLRPAADPRSSRTSWIRASPSSTRASSARSRNCAKGRSWWSAPAIPARRSP